MQFLINGIWVFVTNLLTLPLKFAYEIYLLFAHKKSTLIVAAHPKAYGDLIMNLAMINRIQNNAILVVEKVESELFKMLVLNKGIRIVTRDNLTMRFFWANRVSRIFYPPLFATFHYGRERELLFGFRIIETIDRGIKRDPAFNLLINYLTYYSLLFSRYFIYWHWNLLRWNSRSNQLRSIEYDFTFVYDQVFTLDKTYKKASAEQRGLVVIINILGSEESRLFPLKVLEILVKNLQGKGLSFRFIGISNFALQTTNEYVLYLKKRFPNEEFINLVNQLTFPKVIEQIQGARLVISVETSIPHLCYLLGKTCLVWLDIHKKNALTTNPKKVLDFKKRTMWWNWKNKTNIFYINSSFFDLEISQQSSSFLNDLEKKNLQKFLDITELKISSKLY